MSDEEFDKKVEEIEDNMKVVEAYEKMYEQVKEVNKIINESVGE